MSSDQHHSPPVKVSERAGTMAPFTVMETIREANKIEEKRKEANIVDAPAILHLEVGQPSTPPPLSILSALSCEHNSLGYTPSLGIHSLRAAISRHYRKWYDLDVPFSCIAVTAGASGAIVATFMACFDKGDRVALAVPEYPCYRNVLSGLCVEVVPILVDSRTNYQPTIEHLKAALPLDGVVVASPSNPTGSALKESQMNELVKFCRENGIRLIVDEIYHGVGVLPETAMKHEDVVVISSFSKYWCMTGFRIGWLASRDEAFMSAVERCLQHFFICASTISQHAAEKVLGDEYCNELEAHAVRYKKNQVTLVNGLRRCGFQMEMPDGAFYVWANCEDVCRRLGLKDSIELSEVFLRKTNIAVTTGIDFDKERGHSFVRFSAAGSEGEMEEAVRRLLEFCPDPKKET